MTTNTGTFASPATVLSTRAMPSATSPTSPGITMASTFSSVKNFRYFFSASMFSPESSFTGPSTPSLSSPSASLSTKVSLLPADLAARVPMVTSLAGPGSNGAAHSLSACGTASAGGGVGATGFGVSTGLGGGSAFFSGQAQSIT